MILVSLILLGIAVGLSSLLLRLLRKPIKWAFKLLLHALFGFIFLFLFNFFGAWVDLSLELNWFNAAVTGVLGLPGVVILLLVKYIL